MPDMAHGPNDVLIIEERGSSDADHYRVRAGELAHECWYTIEPGDGFDEAIRWYLDDYLLSPLLEEKRAAHARQAIVTRGTHLWRNLARLESVIEGGREAGCREIRVIGSGRIFSRPWEILRRREGEDPIAIRIPVVRVLSGSRAYPVAARRPGLLRVLSISARLAPPQDPIPPRRISLFLARKKWLHDRLDFQVVEPGSLGHLKQMLDIEQDVGGFDVLHVDAHGELLESATLRGTYSEVRRLTEETGLLAPIARYDGRRGFVMLECGAIGLLPVTGQELAALAKAHGIRTIVLNACRAGSQEAAGSVATELVRSGVPDVVAFGHLLTLRGAELLIDGFYDALARDLSVAEAVRIARRTMYQEKRRDAADGETVDLDDWVSLVHYQAEDAAYALAPHGFLAAAADEVIDNRPSRDALEELPQRWEWYVRLLHRSLETDQPPMIVYGIRGAGANFVVDEFLRWTTLKTRRLPWPVVANMAGGLAEFVEELANGTGIVLPPGTTDPEDILAGLVRGCRQEPRLFAFLDIDKALDGGAADTEQVSFVYRLAKALRAAGSPVILTDTVEPTPGTRSRPLEDLGPRLALAIRPLFWRDLADWTYFPAAPAEDDVDALSRILVGVLGGGLPPLVWLRHCPDAHALEAILDVLVLHAGDQCPEAWDRMPEICRRDLNESCQAVTTRMADWDGAWPTAIDKLAVVGASATWTHLGMLEIDAPRNERKAAAGLKDEMMTLIELSRLGLAQQAPEWDLRRYRFGVYQFDPHLRHCLRRRRRPEDMARWDRSHHVLYTSLLKQFHFRNEEVGGRESVRDLLAFDLPNMLIALWRALRGHAPLFDVVEGFVDAINANIWPGRLDLRPWLVRRLCRVGDSEELTADRRIDLAKSMAALASAVGGPLAEKARTSVGRVLASLEEATRHEVALAAEAIMSSSARRTPGKIEAELAYIDTLAQVAPQDAFIAAISLGEDLRRIFGRDLADADAAYQKALDLGRTIGPSREAMAHYGLGVTEVLRNRLDAAEDHLRAALELAADNGLDLVVAESYYELGLVFEMRGALNYAKSYYRRAITRGREINCVSAIIHSYQNWVNIELNQGVTEVACALLDKADEVLEHATICSEDRVAEESRNRMLRARIEIACGDVENSTQPGT